MIIKMKDETGKSWRYIDNVHDIKCYPAKENDVSMVSCEPMTTIVEVYNNDGSYKVIDIDWEAYLLNDAGKTLERLHL